MYLNSKISTLRGTNPRNSLPLELATTKVSQQQGGYWNTLYAQLQKSRSATIHDVFSRLVIVPKRDPGTPKDSLPTSYRVTMDALVNNCLKPVASTLPLATDEIKKLHSKRFFFELDAMHAFWAIPLDEESKKLMDFKPMKEFLLGAGSQWDDDQQVKSNKRRTTMPWTCTCQASTFNASQCTLMTWRQESTL
jgi:hypothetical protein